MGVSADDFDRYILVFAYIVHLYCSFLYRRAFTFKSVPDIAVGIKLTVYPDVIYRRFALGKRHIFSIRIDKNMRLLVKTDKDNDIQLRCVDGWIDDKSGTCDPFYLYQYIVGN